MASRAFIPAKEFVLGRRTRHGEARISRKARNNTHFLHFKKLNRQPHRVFFGLKQEWQILACILRPRGR
jgi:hypothetical protein